MTTIPKSKYLQALGLFTLATEHYAKSREFELAMGEVLGIEDDGGGYFGVVSNAVYDNPPATVASFDKALKEAGFTVAAKKAGR